MDNLNQTFETLKRVNASLHKVNSDLINRLTITTSELAKIYLRNQQLEQMLGAISAQCEKDLKNKDIEIRRFEDCIFQARNELEYHQERADRLVDQRDIELKLLVSIIRGEI